MNQGRVQDRTDEEDQLLVTAHHLLYRGPGGDVLHIVDIVDDVNQLVLAAKKAN